MTEFILFVVQGNYDYGDGWEDLTASTDIHEAYAAHTAYLMNDEQGRFRVVKRQESE